QKDQLVFYSVGKDKGKDYYYSGGFGNFMTGKLVVLIDQNTASASEILTGALQDWDRAVVVGRRSFGKGLMQRPVDLFDGSVLELTGARYYTPSGRSIQKPYRGADYADNVHTRLASGELTDANVIHFPDSLKYTTLVSKRTVYGGGGIMPDKYVPIDTTEYAGWLQTVTNGGLVNKVTFDYMDSNRTVLMQQYKDFNSFNKQFTVPANLVQEIVTTAEKSGLMLQPRSKDRTLSLLTLDIKGQIAGQLFASNDYYLQVMNSDNNSYRTALEILENPALYAGYLKSAAGVKKK
ncbi:MAG TPA: S41 family peptidase, partial [Chitinophaga sp.]|nr:S41 family peptidase [Chitinophaga sp.]